MRKNTSFEMNKSKQPVLIAILVCVKMFYCFSEENSNTSGNVAGTVEQPFASIQKAGDTENLIYKAEGRILMTETREKTNFWKKNESEEKTEYESENISFILSAKGILENIQWRNAGIRAERLNLKILSGQYYQRDALNRLPDFLNFPKYKISTEKINGTQIRLELEFFIHDMLLNREIKIDGKSGEIEIADRIRKNGPGQIRLQMDYETVLPDAWTSAAYIPSRGSILEIWGDTPADQEVRDQDTHTIRRSWVIDQTFTKFSVEGSRYYLSLSSLKNDFSICELTHGCRPGNLYCQNYADDFYLNENEERESIVRYSIIEASAEIRKLEKTGSEKKLILNLDSRLASLKKRADTYEYADNKLRRDLINWKRSEFEKYLREANYHECEMLLNDIETILESMQAKLPLEIPAKDELLYENTFEKLLDDWSLYGAGRIETSEKKGIHIIPNVTMDIWSEKDFSGDFLVEFDFFSSSEHQRGGTFLQLCAKSNVERDNYDFMCSATGYMPDYNFGISCYHFSFNRGGSSGEMSNVSNFRKTGKGFYLLSQIPDPAPERKKWYHLSFIKKASRFLFAVDGKIVQEYIDRGHQGKILDSGKIGIRNWGRQSAIIRNFRVYKIK